MKKRLLRFSLPELGILRASGATMKLFRTWTKRERFGNLGRRCGDKLEMCLAIPAKVIQVEAAGKGKVDYLGTKINVDLSLLEKVRPGDWVIIHAGFAITRLDEEEAQETLALLREVVRAQGE